VGALRLCVRLQGIHPFQADRQDSHRLVGASAYFLFDPAKREWSRQACTAWVSPGEAAARQPLHRRVGEVTEEAARLTGLLPGTPVVTAAATWPQRNLGRAPTGMAKRTCALAQPPGWASPPPNSRTTRISRCGAEPPAPQKWVIAGEMETGGGAPDVVPRYALREPVRASGGRAIHLRDDQQLAKSLEPAQISCSSSRALRRGGALSCWTIIRPGWDSPWG